MWDLLFCSGVEPGVLATRPAGKPLSPALNVHLGCESTLLLEHIEESHSAFSLPAALWHVVWKKTELFLEVVLELLTLLQLITPAPQLGYITMTVLHGSHKLVTGSRVEWASHSLH